MPRSHLDGLRGDVRPPRSSLTEGRFGRMFRRLSPCPELGETVLRDLAKRMRDQPEAGGGWGGATPDPREGDNPAVPAAYTYFGQFVDHDITFDPVSQLQRDNDPDSLVDFRTPRCDLDSVYGSGPADEPFQYEKDSDPPRFLMDRQGDGQQDLPRNRDGIALIGDPRNDENTIVSQLQLAFLKLHNKLADHVASEGALPREQWFAEAQRLVRWHYQWVVVHDFLPKIAGQEVVDQVWPVDDELERRDEIKTRYYRPTKNVYMPVEFSAAAYRYGHSQVRAAYDLNQTVTDRPIFAPGDQVSPTDDLRGFGPLPPDWTIEWPRFIPIGGSTPQPSRRIDTKLVAGLFDLPGLAADQEQSLALRNLKRGEALGLPSGQDVARAMRIEPLSPAQLDAPEPTPLWFYLLREAEVHGDGGTHLGPTGGRIVAEVLLGLLRADPNGFYAVDPAWTPTLPAAGGSPRTFNLGDLLAFATT